MDSKTPDFQFFDRKIHSVNQIIDPQICKGSITNLSIKREDQIHPFISGNKFRKLKYVIKDAVLSGKDALLTYGGAYSNHITAVAEAGRHCHFKTIGVIRGEEVEARIEGNPTLRYALSCGMTLKFVSRAQYKNKHSTNALKALKEEFGEFYEIPEGGTNHLAVKGCEEILLAEDSDYDHICVSVGTGGTLAGIVNASKPYQKVIGFSALKGDFLTSEVKKYTAKNNFEITDSFSFGGYAKIDRELIRFINNFKTKTKIQLDPIYTGKMMFGIFELFKQGYFEENSRILAIHTGGIQGIEGMNQKLNKLKLPQIIT
ncbi:1-aminocyclopropane-1-carboxylate deaminase/D-cysteine desulfhydrase [Constantimarinum furrinae]|uniref:D-cysteine desulfhydrase n=1 Tax=Constantimarinum furrinae TaxID=2562285 RepID=A0A7G8PUD5_9FLAO|nr:pyridoxal-phosphate dependent enzyme [Constantimarinum furrinae]QNJ97951.1 D-cysteine desulfhydrase [Constantimarinum furrinae]